MAIFQTNGITIQFKEDNTGKVLEALKIARERGLASCGEKAVKYAQDLVPIDTGRLKGSITYAVDGDDCYIGTNVEYAPYIEFGTGQYAETGGRKTPWTYQDSNGNWHQTNGYRPHPFLRPAASEHSEEYVNILRNSLKNI